MDKKRIQFDFEGRQLDRLDALAEATGVSRAEVIKDALRVYDWLSEIDPDSVIEAKNASGEIIWRGKVKLLQ